MSSGNTTTNSIPDLSNTYGSALIGLLVSTFLSGVMTLQTHLYFQRSTRDSLVLKIFVAALWTIDMAHFCVISEFVYHFVISNWGNTAVLKQSTWSLGLEELLNTWITFIVQMFFIYRARVLSHFTWWSFTPLYLLAAVQLGFGTGGGIKSLLPQTVGHLASTRWRAGVWLISGAVNDILIASILSYYLYTQRTVTSQRLIDQLIAYSMNTGLLTSLLAFVDIGCFIAMPDNYIHLAFNFVLGRIYTNSLLASLNMREHIRRITSIKLSTQGSSTADSEYGSRATQLGSTSRPTKVTINALPVNREDLAADGIHFYHGKSGSKPQLGMGQETPDSVTEGSAITPLPV